MTRKDFVLIAKIIREIDDKDVRHQTALNFAHHLKGVNARFDASRFIAACEPKRKTPCPVRDGLSVSFNDDKENTQ